MTKKSSQENEVGWLSSQSIIPSNDQSHIVEDTLEFLRMFSISSSLRNSSRNQINKALLSSSTFSSSSSTSTLASTRCLSTSPIRSDESSNKGSTSALDYKLQHRLRKLPPLPSLEPPTMQASEAVSNILYNTPAPSKQPFKR